VIPTNDAYDVCRYVQHYWRKNGYGPDTTGLEPFFVEQLVQNGIIEVLPLYEGGPPVAMVLTEKGTRMANTERRRR
jgi:hypothetical protein